MLVRKKLLRPYELSKRIRALADKGDITKAISKVKQAPQGAQNAAVWGTLIQIVIEAARYKQAYRLFTDMKRRGISPTTRTFSTILSGYQNIKDWTQFPVQFDNVSSLYDQLKHHHHGLRLRSPISAELSHIPYTHLISIFGNAQDFQRMYDVFNAMPDDSSPLAPSIHTYTALLNALANRRLDGQAAPSGNAADARLVWHQLLLAAKKRPRDLQVDSHALRAFLKILGRSDRPSDHDLAFEVAHEYLELAPPRDYQQPPRLRPPPLKVALHPLTLESLFLLCNNAKKYDYMLHYVRQVIDSRSMLLLDTRHMNIVLEAHAARAALRFATAAQDALDTLQWMHRMAAIPPTYAGKGGGGIGPQIRPDSHTYDLVALACCRASDWPRLCRTFELMTGLDPAQFEEETTTTTTTRPPGRHLARSGTSIVPTARFMVSMLDTVSQCRRQEDAAAAAGLRQALSILEYYGLDTICSDHGHDPAPAVPATQENETPPRRDQVASTVTARVLLAKKILQAHARALLSPTAQQSPRRWGVEVLDPETRVPPRWAKLVALAKKMLDEENAKGAAKGKKEKKRSH